MTHYKGTIITCDDKNNVFSHLVEDSGKIVFVGDELPPEYANAPTVELGEQALIPCFVDTHMHFASFATFHAGLNVMKARDNVQIERELKEFAKSYKGKIVIGFGASPYSVKEGRLINRTELDRAVPDKPALIIKYDGHACIVNTKLLNLLKDKIKDLRGYHEDSGEMNQEAFFAVSNYITDSLSIFELVKNMQKAADYIASKGIGMVHTVSGVGFSGDLDVDLEKWVGRGLQNGFQLRIFMQTLTVEKAAKRKFPRIGGCFECALDGCFGSQDAAMNEPYENSTDKGVLYYTDEQVIEFCKKANRRNMQIELHAIGDAAVDQAARAIKAALDDYPREDHRHGIIHACLPTEQALKICKEYSIQLPVQTSFINWPQEPDEYLEKILGERAARLNPLKTFLDNSITLCAGSDAPCTDPDPILWIHNACNHSVKEESVSVYEALRMCTYNGCKASFDEKERGSLEIGKIADMTLLSASPYSVPTEQLKTIQVKKLYLQGKEYKNQSAGAVATVLKGMLSKKKI